MRLIHRLEPLLWLLFGAGGFAAALILPGLLLGLELGAVGAFGERATSYHRMYGLVANPFARLILIGALSVVFWHSAHHLRHLALDMGLKRLEPLLCYGLYGLALLSTAAAVATVAAL